MLPRVVLPLLVLAGLAGLAGCGSSGDHPARAASTATPSAAASASATPGAASSPAASPRPHDWTRFGYDAARTGVAPTGPSLRHVRGLRAHAVRLAGTVDSSPVLVHGVAVGGARHDLLVVTTTYGRTLGLDAATGRRLWRFTPSSYAQVAGTPQITTATPVADPAHGVVFAVSPDGDVHRLSLADGHETGGAWPVSVTRDPAHEKIASALNLTGRDVLVTTGGYIGDAPPYQGKIVAIDRTSGRVRHVFNSLCADRRAIIQPSSCRASDSAIWGRGGAVVDPATHRVYAATGNAPFNGSTNWGDSVLELTAGLTLRRHFTPASQADLNRSDADVGSASPALLPSGRGRGAAFLLQGGKDNRLRLLSLRTSLHGVEGAAGARLGGEVQVLPQPGGASLVSAPLVLHRGGRTEVVVASPGGTVAYRLTRGRLRALWSTSTGGTSPVVAGGLLYVYDPAGGLNVYRPGSGARVRHFSVPAGHWNSPIVADGRIYVPSGDANDHATSGRLTILR